MNSKSVKIELEGATVTTVASLFVWLNKLEGRIDESLKPPKMSVKNVKSLEEPKKETKKKTKKKSK